MAHNGTSLDPLPLGMLMAGDDPRTPETPSGLVVDLVRTVTVVVVGSVEPSNVASVVAGIDRAAATSDIVLLDLGGVRTIDVTGLRAIASARRMYGDRLQIGRTSAAFAEALAEHAPQPVRTCGYGRGDAGGSSVHR
jgi:hypothetical protein